MSVRACVCDTKYDSAHLGQNRAVGKRKGDIQEARKRLHQKRFACITHGRRDLKSDYAYKSTCDMAVPGWSTHRSRWVPSGGCCSSQTRRLQSCPCRGDANWTGWRALACRNLLDLIVVGSGNGKCSLGALLPDDVAVQELLDDLSQSCGWV